MTSTHAGTPGLTATQRADLSRSLILADMAGVIAPTETPKPSHHETIRRYWEEMATHPNRVVYRQSIPNAEGEAEEFVVVGFVEPADERTPLNFLGHGGKVFSIHSEEREDVTLTCNAWSFQNVPAEYEHLYPSTCRFVKGWGFYGPSGLAKVKAVFDAAIARQAQADEDAREAGVGA